VAFPAHNAKTPPTVAERIAARRAYMAAERAGATQWTASDPRARRWALGWTARKFLIQNDAEAWLDRPTRVRPEWSVHCWPFEWLPTIEEPNALYKELWEEIIREGRYHGP
jgi:hypothetical protein